MSYSKNDYIVSFSCWSCSSVENLLQRYENQESERQRNLCDGLWAIGRGKGTVSGYDKQLVDLVLVTNGAYKLNQDSVAEYFHTTMSVYLNSARYGSEKPKKVEAFYKDDKSEYKMDSSSVGIFLDAQNRVGVSVKKDFPAGTSHVKLILVSDENPVKELVLNFDIFEKRKKPRCWSKSTIEFYEM